MLDGKAFICGYMLIFKFSLTRVVYYYHSYWCVYDVCAEMLTGVFVAQSTNRIQRTNFQTLIFFTSLRQGVVY